jgi:hypothetical protein
MSAIGTILPALDAECAVVPENDAAAETAIEPAGEPGALSPVWFGVRGSILVGRSTANPVAQTEPLWCGPTTPAVPRSGFTVGTIVKIGRVAVRAKPDGCS